MQKLLPGILMFMMVVQAVITVAYVHQAEASGIEYVSFDHDHELSADAGQTTSEKSDKRPVDDFGCHHCCHCTGIFSYENNAPFKAVLAADKIFSYDLSLPSALISPHLRPPIV
ncbi:MAG TPA: hypothetical protein ENI91_09250 [Sphingomonadales bacterium]|nr:hypothetical protein [Sphingomonadales bacterium]